MKPQQRIEHACFWMELKQSWEEWSKTGHLPPLSPEAQQYFEELAQRSIRSFVARHPALFQSVPPPGEGQEAWSIILEYLTRVRRITRTRLLDAIFENALRKAAAKFGGVLAGPQALEEAIGWILNQFYTRVISEAMRDYVRQHAPPPPEVQISSLERPITEDGSSTRTVGDVIPAKDDGGWAGGLEGREITAMSESAATKAFSTAKPSLRLGLALRVLRVRRSVTISCAEPTVLALAGVAKSVFADGANECLTSLSQELDRSPAIHELDSEARAYAGRKATAALMDEAEEWLLQGAWIPEFCRVERRPAGPVGPQTAGCTAFLGKATNLARILNERLAKAGELFSENEMAPVFAYLEKPACPC